MRVNTLNASNYKKESGVKIIALAPCPFCQCEFVDIRHSFDANRYYGCCASCGSMSSWCAEFSIAVSAWNRDRPAEIVVENLNNTQQLHP